MILGELFLGQRSRAEEEGGSTGDNSSVTLGFSGPPAEKVSVGPSPPSRLAGTTLSVEGDDADHEDDPPGFSGWSLDAKRAYARGRMEEKRL